MISNFDDKIHSLKETKAHGDLDFPFNIYTNYFNSLFEDYIHWHDELEITYIESGEGIVSIDLDTFNIKTGDIILIKKGALHHINNVASSTLTASTFVFHHSLIHNPLMDYCEKNFISPLINNIVHITPIITSNNEGYYELLDFFLKIRSSYTKKEFGYQLEIKGLLSLTISTFYKFGYICEVKDALKEKHKRRDTIQKVLLYINDNYNSKIHVYTLAKIANYSDYHFLRFFKSVTGKTVTQYINSLRLEKACHLLDSTNLSISEISYTVGFNDTSYFIKIFKKHYSLSPSKFKKHLAHSSI